MLRFSEDGQVLNEDEYSAILVGLELNEDISYSMKELEGLAEAANVDVEAIMVQHLERPNNATFIGKGKVEELADLAAKLEVDTVIFNDELTGVQIRNLEDATGKRVIDRTILILDIFAARASSKEGKLQVELAQLQYRMPRLTGFGNSLSRLGGGIGTRGPGEKKLETDKRHIRRRIDDIRAELKEIKSTRETQRSRRVKNEIPLVALVGYTNSGKSAIMNRLMSITDKDEKMVFEKDMLFATLDTAQRNVVLDSNHQFILIDTVGFVSKLPHSLVNAFKSTLEEVCYADLLVHVVDAAYDNHEFQIEVTDKVIKEIGAGDKEKIIAYNKCDLIREEDETLLPRYGCDTVYVSAKEGRNIDELIEQIKSKIYKNHVIADLLIPYSRGDLSSYLCEKASVNVMEYRDDGTFFNAELKLEDYNRYKEFEI
ncbi:MAG: GTPase HflX [Clostridiales bacterium]|jgi:GTP-binding protein HflX|nr:GTPase HflX [Clostridiales bacterium]